MGFMDKAKKMAEQAQAKLDEAQKQFNAGEQSGPPAVEYDSHGRPIAREPQAPSTPPHGDPLAGQPSAATVPPPPVADPAPTPGVPPTSQRSPDEREVAGSGDPLSAGSAAPSAPAAAVPPVEPPAPAAATPPAVPPVEPPGVPSTTGAPPADAAGPHAPPARPEADAADEDRNHPSYAPPKLSGGDPLAG